METGKSVARLRLVRELLGRTGREDEGEERDEGFTLIELMVVLLIMGILLAIAIPTFLSVTGGAKKTAAQSNLTNAMTSTTGYYSQFNTFPFTGTTVPNVTKMIAYLDGTQTSITFVKPTVSPKKGQNSVSVLEPTTSIVVLSAKDGAGYCWVASNNQGAATTHFIRGDGFYGNPTHTATCKAASYKTLAVATWHSNFKTIQTPKT